MNDKTVRTSISMKPGLLEECDLCWKAHGFSSRNEFINRAVEEFITALKVGSVDDELVGRLADAIAKASDANAVKISKGLFRYAVGQDMIMQMLAAAMRIAPEDVQVLRRRAIRSLRSTKGKISLEAIAEFYNEDIPRLSGSEAAEEDAELEAALRDILGGNPQDTG